MRAGPGALSALLILIAFFAVPAAAQPASSLEFVIYESPVPAPVIDPFRPPAHIGAPGNRGLEYGVNGGEWVQASAPGTVTFAGLVAQTWYVTIQHDDGIRTTYGHIGSLSVRQGQFVLPGTVIATALPGFHFSARVGDTYLDPAVLLEPPPLAKAPARLVPVALPPAGSDAAR